MRVRPMDSNGDYTIGVPWLVNSPQCVEQCIRTRLKLWKNEWFLDKTEGTDWLGEVLQERYGKNPDSVIQQRILETQGVDSIVDYASSFAGSTRKFTVNARVLTIYSATPVDIVEVL